MSSPTSAIRCASNECPCRGRVVGHQGAGGDHGQRLADPPGFDARRPHIVLGAHLDTVPQAPGAEDNASGVAVLVELARMLSEQPARLPVRLVAFGAEESRRSGWQWYAFGSRHFVGTLDAAQRKAVRAMVSLDRVGRATTAVPVCHGGRGSTAVADDLRDAATIRRRRASTGRATTCRSSGSASPLPDRERSV